LEKIIDIFFKLKKYRFTTIHILRDMPTHLISFDFILLENLLK